MLTEGNEFQYFHAFERLARDGKATPLTCFCGAQYITISKDGQLALWCPAEDFYEFPGEAMRYRVEQTVKTFGG